MLDVVNGRGEYSVQNGYVTGTPLPNYENDDEMNCDEPKWSVANSQGPS